MPEGKSNSGGGGRRSPPPRHRAQTPPRHRAAPTARERPEPTTTPPAARPRPPRRATTAATPPPSTRGRTRAPAASARRAGTAAAGNRQAPAPRRRVVVEGRPRVGVLDEPPVDEELDLAAVGGGGAPVDGSDEASFDEIPAPDYTKKRRRTRRLVEDGIIVAVAVGVAILVRAFVAQAYYIPSGSMLPQLNIDDRVVVSRLAYDLHAPRRGDIVVFKAPPALASTVHTSKDPVVRWARDFGVALGLVEDQTVVIKRVIGLPGEAVSAHGGNVYINGELLLEPYLPKGTVTSTFGPVTVPKGDVWVMGDNRGDSYDSRYFGPIPQHTIIGRAIWKVWPFWRASFL